MLQSSAFGAYDTEKVVAHARSYVREFEKAGIPRDRICIKIPSTGPALNASPILLKEGIRTLGTSLFSVAQAIAASQAGCLSISPYYNCKASRDYHTVLADNRINWNLLIVPWYHADRSQWPDVEDPALYHPMSPRLVQIQQVYRQLREHTGKEQPLLKPARYETMMKSRMTVVI